LVLCEIIEASLSGNFLLMITEEALPPMSRPSNLQKKSLVQNTAGCFASSMTWEKIPTSHNRRSVLTDLFSSGRHARILHRMPAPAYVAG
jgi:hypothetical protein